MFPGSCWGPPTGTSGNTELKVSGQPGGGGLGRCASALMWAHPVGKLILPAKVLPRRGSRLPKEAGWGITVSTAASLVGRHQRGAQARARQAGTTGLEESVQELGRNTRQTAGTRAEALRMLCWTLAGELGSGWDWTLMGREPGGRDRGCQDNPQQLWCRRAVLGTKRQRVEWQPQASALWDQLT